MTATDVAGDILTHLIPGALVVPSMVATIAVLQSTIPLRVSYAIMNRVFCCNDARARGLRVCRRRLA